MAKLFSTSKDSYADSDTHCIYCGHQVVRKGKVTISEDGEFIRIRYHCRHFSCGKEFDGVYRFLDFDLPEERKYGAL